MTSPQDDQPQGPDIHYIAQLARLDINENEAELFKGQLNDILSYIEQLNEVDISGIEPTQHSVPVANVMREDVAKPWDVHQQAMENAPASHQGQFVVPRIVE